ncbi:putative methyltransferase [candidate division WWE3 bacterium]|nr:putative methyltransferase [candidate division WWE3 bacterium]
MSAVLSITEIQKQNKGLSKPQIEGILYLILKNPGMTNASLIRKTGLPKETLRRFKSTISTLLQEPEGDEILFKLEYTSEIEELAPKPYAWSLVEFADPDLEDRLMEIRKAHDLAPKREYDQFFATVNTSVAKVKIMEARGDLEGKRIALLGEDDLLSVVMGLAETPYTQITVFDIDQDILDTINSIVEEQGFENIRTELYDARNELRPELRGRFDVVVTDPPYTTAGIKLFLEWALQFLGPNSGKHIYLYYGNSFKTPEKTFQIQELIAKYNLLIKEKINRFARYHGAESIGSASSLYLLETLSSTHQPLKKKITNIYTYQEPHSADFPFVEHFTFKLYDVPEPLLSSKNRLQKILGKFCDYHRLKVVDTDITRFSRGGYTFNYTLSTSSLTVHTWPELNAVHVVLVTCEPVAKPERLYENLSLLFKTKKIEIEKIE